MESIRMIRISFLYFIFAFLVGRIVRSILRSKKKILNWKHQYPPETEVNISTEENISTSYVFPDEILLQATGLKITLKKIPVSGVDADSSSFQEYCYKKIEGFLSKIGKKQVILIGCSEEKIWEMVQITLARTTPKIEIHDVVEPDEKKESCENGLCLFSSRISCLDRSEQIVVLRVPPGCHTDLFAKAILLNKKKLLATYSVPEIYEDSQVFEYSYDLRSDKELKRVVEKSVIVIGLPLTNPFTDVFRMDGAFAEAISGGRYWSAKVFQEKGKTFKICFIEWIPTFLGEISYQIARSILHLGALQILHVCNNVQTFSILREKNVITPSSFFIKNLKGELNEHIKIIENCLFNAEIGSGLHVSLKHPLVETQEMVDLVARHGVTSVETESGYFAKAVADFNVKFKKRVQYGAIYHATNYALGKNEKMMFFAQANRNPSFFNGTLNMDKDVVFIMSAVLYTHCRNVLVLDEFSPIKLPLSYSPYRRAIAKIDEFELNTREWQVQKIIQLAGVNKAVFLLSEAGMGKSTFFASLAMRFCEPMAREFSENVTDYSLSIVAVHFFTHDDMEESSIKFALKSLSSQLCYEVSGFSTYLAENEEELKARLEEIERDAEFSAKIEKLLKILIIDPARSLTNAGLQPRERKVILIDALDECEAINEFTSVINSCWEQAPDWLVLIASSRPRSSAKLMMSDKDIVELIPTDQQNMDDLRTFAKQRMFRKFNVNDEKIIEDLVHKSQGVFIWLSFQEKEFEKLPDNRNLTLSDIKNLPTGLGATYQKYFMRLYQALNQDNQLYRRAISIGFVINRAPLPESIWKLCLGFGDGLDDLQNYQKLKSCFETLLVFTKNGYLGITHKSMIDWLCDKKDPTSAYSTKQFYLAIDIMDQKLNHSILGKVLDEQIYPQIDNSITYNVFENDPSILTKAQHFACAHVLYHLSQGDEYKNIKHWLFDFTPLFWLTYEARMTQNFVRLISDLQVVEDHLDSSFITKLFRLSQEALNNDPRELCGQILGRMIPKTDISEQESEKSCRQWLKDKPENIKCFIPASINLPALESCQTNL